MAEKSDAWEFECKIYYEDVDVGGVCYHSRYLNFCERARSNIFFSQDSSPINEGYHFVATTLTAKYKSPGLFGDTLHVRTSVTKLKHASVAMFHSITNQKGMIVFEMEIVLACIYNSKPAKIPEYFYKIFSAKSV